MVALLMSATIFEKVYGSAAVAHYIYGTTWFALFWAVLAVCALCYLCRVRLYRRPVLFLLHLSFAVILLGAGVTHFFGQSGTVHLRQGEALGSFTEGDETTNDAVQHDFPFTVTLNRFELQTYPGTATPMDYISTLRFSDCPLDMKVSMNHIVQHQGYRFYQSGYDPDGAGTQLAVSYDPVGIALTYVGYALLFVSLIFLLVAPHETFRRMLSAARSEKRLFGVALLICGTWIAGGIPTVAAPTHEGKNAAQLPMPKHLPKTAAQEFGTLYVLWNGRICPLQTVARDFTTKLYGRDTYRGLTAEQVFTGWYFFPSSWGEQPMIRIKSAAARRVLGISSQYAAWNDYIDPQRGNKIAEALDTQSGLEEANEKYNILAMHLSGRMLYIYPCHPDTLHAETIRWCSPGENLPMTLPSDQWFFIRKSMDYVGELVQQRDYEQLSHTLQKIRAYQVREAGDALPSEGRFRAELLYNDLRHTRPVAMVLLTLGLLSFGFTLYSLLRGIKSRLMTRLSTGLLLCSLIYLAVLLALRGYVSGHLPMTNGYETMQLMSFCSLALTLGLHRRYALALPFGFMLGGLTMLVSMLGEANPTITPLIPVLASPLLSLHVVLIMLAYSLLAFTMLNGVTALILRRDDQQQALQRLSALILYPALCLLAAGIFVGAIWANCSWGRYWGWDPKEVWALITLLLYALPLHRTTFRSFDRPRFFHVFLVLAFLSVLMTYFGVNFLLGGMHSYANG